MAKSKSVVKKAPAKAAKTSAAPTTPAKDERPAFANSETRDEKSDEPAHVGGGRATKPLAYPVQ